MMGYAMINQRAGGIHLRQRARAFVIEDTPGHRIVYVSADICMVFQEVRLLRFLWPLPIFCESRSRVMQVRTHVLQKLQATFGTQLYTEDNVMLHGTHTHAGPAGFAYYILYGPLSLSLSLFLSFKRKFTLHYFLLSLSFSLSLTVRADLTSFGFIEDNFNVIVNGIYNAIVMAHNNMRPARIFVNTGTLLNSNIKYALLYWMFFDCTCLYLYHLSLLQPLSVGVPPEPGGGARAVRVQRGQDHDRLEDRRHRTRLLITLFCSSYFTRYFCVCVC
jgi:neutral ceramidase